MSNRWWIYQRERFPVLSYGALALVLSYSVSAFSALAGGMSRAPDAVTSLCAALGVFLFFVLMRVADEFKDADDDRRYRPYRAVPRGLVKLEELALVGALAAVGQLLVATLFDPRVTVLLGIAWAYLGLMTVEFFAPRWLKARPFAYLASHMPMVGFITLYASAHEWIPSRGTPPPGLIWVLAASILLGAMLEIARKIRAPADEEPGVDTYTSVWGRRTAVLAWLSAFLLAGACGHVAARFIGFGSSFGLGFAALGIVASIVAWRFLREPTGPRAQRAEVLSGVIALAAYAGLGPIALLFV